jgi:site-specific DNA-cytosine methylase
MNPLASQNRRVVSQGQRSTGTCFQAIAQFLAGHPETRTVILENVMGLAVADQSTGEVGLNICTQTLEGLGFWVHVFRLCPTDYGIPQTRRRLWIVAIRRSYLAECGVTSEAVETTMRALMDKFCGHVQLDVDHFLLAEDDALVARQRAAAARSAPEHRAPQLAEGKRRRTAAATATPPPAWLRKNMAKCDESGTTWLDLRLPEPAALQAYPELRRLTYREWDTLLVHGIRLPEKAGRVIDLSQSSDRNGPRLGAVGCVIPGARMLHTRRCRLLLGQEAMALQAIFYANNDAVREAPNRLCMDLAGNAFNGACVLAVSLSALLAVPLTGQGQASQPKILRRLSSRHLKCGAHAAALPDFSLVWESDSGESCGDE